MLPEGWDQHLLGSIAEPITSGSRGWAAYYSEDGCPFVRITNLRRETIFPDYRNLKYVRLPSGSQEGQRTRLRQGDILVSITADLGIIGYIEQEPAAASYINQHIARVRIKAGRAIPKFVAYQLASDRHRKVIQRLNDAGAKSGLNLPTIASIPIVLPPLPEQWRIAAVLDAWDAAIATAERLVAADIARKRAFVDKLIFAANESSEIGDVAEQTGEAAGSGFASYPVLSCTKHDGLVLSDEYFDRQVYGVNRTSYKKVEPGSFAYATNHVEEGSIGLNLTGRIGIVSPMYTTFRARTVHAPYLIAVLKTERLRRGFERMTPASVNRRGGLRWPDFATIVVPTPSLHEQKRVAEEIETAQRAVVQMGGRLALLRHQKRGLMQQLLTGRLRVPDSIDALLPAPPALASAA